MKYLYVLTSGTSTATSRGTTESGTPCSTRVPTRFSTVGGAGSTCSRAMIDAHDRMNGTGSGEAFLLGPYLDVLPAAVVRRVRIGTPVRWGVYS
jgi:hypothetical protein